MASFKGSDENTKNPSEKSSVSESEYEPSEGEDTEDDSEEDADKAEEELNVLYHRHVNGCFVNIKCFV